MENFTVTTHARTQGEKHGRFAYAHIHQPLIAVPSVTFVELGGDCPVLHHNFDSASDGGMGGSGNGKLGQPRLGVKAYSDNY